MYITADLDGCLEFEEVGLADEEFARLRAQVLDVVL